MRWPVPDALASAGGSGQGKVFAQGRSLFRATSRVAQRQLEDATTQAAYAEVMTHIEASNVRRAAQDRWLPPYRQRGVSKPVVRSPVAFIHLSIGGAGTSDATGREAAHNNKSPAAEIAGGAFA